MSLRENSGSNYKKFAQFKTAINHLRSKPTDFINFLNLNEDFNINYKIQEICSIDFEKPYTIGTLLNVALRIEAEEIFPILIDRGASVTNKSLDGLTVVHEAIGEDFERQLSSLKDCNHISKAEYAYAAISAHIERDDSENPINFHGISHFHLASMIDHREAVEYFLKNGVKIDEAVNENSPVLPGFTALHFAAMYASYKAAEILLNHGADANLKDARGMSALHILVEEKLKTLPTVLRMPTVLRINTLENYYLENINFYFNSNDKILKLFLKNSRNHDFDPNVALDDIGFSRIHITSMLQDESAIKQLPENNMKNVNLQIKSDSVITPGYTALHFAAALCNEKTFKFLLEKGANMGINDVRGICPFDLCLISFKISNIYSILSQHPTWKTIVFSDGKTKLLDFIGAMRKSEDFHSFLDGTDIDINMFVPLDSPICAGYTPLHLCVICRKKLPIYNEPEDDEHQTIVSVSYDPMKTTLYKTRIKQCLDMGANICTQDARGSTPLHWAFHAQESSLVDLLLGYHKRFDNPTNDDGLSHLHIASASGNENVVMKLLLNNRADVKSKVKIDYFWYRNKNRTRCVVKSGSTPLHFAGVTKSLKVMEILLQCDADVLAVDDVNCDAMEKALGPRSSVERFFSESYQYLLPNTLTLLSQSEDQLRDKILNKLGLTELHAACITNDVKAVRKLLQRDDVDVDARVDDKSADWNGMTPLFCYVVGIYLRRDSSPDLSIAQILLQRGADVLKIRCGGTVIHRAFKLHCYKRIILGVETLEVPDESCKNDLGLLKLLLSYQHDFSVNPTTSSGLSHLHIACACNNHEMVMEFLKHGADVNQNIDYFCQNYGGNTPLHVAAIYRSNETVDVLLKHGADVTSTNSYNSTPLHVATRIRFDNLYIMEALLRAGADVNAQNNLGATPVDLLIEYRHNILKEIDVCLKNGFRINVFNPVTGQGCLGQTFNLRRGSEFLYKKFIDSTDLSRSDERNRNAIHNVVSMEPPDVEENYTYDTVHEAFPLVDNYTDAIEKLTESNLNIDQQDTEGKTPLHYASRMQNLTAIVGLLNNGADFNILDNCGKTAFEYYMDTYSNSEFVVPIFERVLDVFTSHAWKLYWQDLEVHDSIRKLLKQHKKRQVLRVTGKKCSKELLKLREEQVGSSTLSLLDFLSETSAIVHFQRIPIEERAAVDEFFANKTHYLREKYPEFAGILILQYKKALERITIVPFALDAINVLVGFKMPYVCSDMILQFLSNENLKNLIDAACL